MNNRSKARAAALLASAALAASMLGAPGAKAHEIICPQVPLVRCEIIPTQGGLVQGGPVGAALQRGGNAVGGSVRAPGFDQALFVRNGCLGIVVRNRFVPLPIEFQTPNCQQPERPTSVLRSLRRR